MKRMTASEPCHCNLIRKAARRVSAIYDQELAGSGLRITQYALLAEIELAGPISITHLAAIMVMERNGLGHTLRLLERDGLLVTVTGNDRRSRTVSLTELGQRRLADLHSRWQRAQRRVEATGLMNAIRQPLASFVARNITVS
ncbi:MarR family winged helix-turn-helix transcriptional regulator [Methylobacterium sp. J-030]|uniref:MarR family winged helix-turn-helix transcriptional regulator n=1 Tax=Methylobacterium sp. J-030 TaxID=2836627 RepID=UPI001FBB181E|nr:MarR family winged helix-turn-helix transcriptional regulator [Methylobacterium sp. J-030]MCJ2067733.1 MarR family winged helix-turn-helix transcriptional regulator [Methylobacterium sp. J-030]